MEWTDLGAIKYLKDLDGRIIAYVIRSRRDPTIWEWEIYNADNITLDKGSGEDITNIMEQMMRRAWQLDLG